MTQEEASRGWTCATCGRHVPSWIGECRCGASRPAAPEDTPARLPSEPAGSGPVADSPPRSVPLRSVVVACVLVAALVAAWSWRSRDAAPPSTSSSPSAASATADPPPAAPNEAQRPTGAAPGSGGPGWAAEIALPPASRPLAPVEAASTEEIAQRVIRAVVSIDNQGTRGTGFFTAGLILTNAHVVGSQGFVRVRLADGQMQSGQVLRTVPGLDLAVVRPERVPDGQAMLGLRALSDVRVGQEVLAVGSALGVLQNTVTRGIVSAVRNVGGVTLIQTDAAVNPGNSGGPLVDRQGYAIGITTMKAAGQAESIGFAVAADQARPLLEGRYDQATASGETLQDRLRTAMTDDGRSSGDRAREEATVEFERRVRAVAQAATRLDADWATYRSNCLYSSEIPRGYEREWFALLDRTPLRSPAPACGAWTDSIVKAAGTLRKAMADALDGARAGGVFPGDQRDICRTYRLEWNGWKQ